MDKKNASSCKEDDKCCFFFPDWSFHYSVAPVSESAPTLFCIQDGFELCSLPLLLLHPQPYHTMPEYTRNGQNFFSKLQLRMLRRTRLRFYCPLGVGPLVNLSGTRIPAGVPDPHKKNTRLLEAAFFQVWNHPWMAPLVPLLNPRRSLGSTDPCTVWITRRPLTLWISLLGPYRFL